MTCPALTGGALSSGVRHRGRRHCNSPEACPRCNGVVPSQSLHGVGRYGLDSPFERRHPGDELWISIRFTNITPKQPNITNTPQSIIEKRPNTPSPATTKRPLITPKSLMAIRFTPLSTMSMLQKSTRMSTAASRLAQTTNGRPFEAAFFMCVAGLRAGVMGSFPSFFAGTTLLCRRSNVKSPTLSMGRSCNAVPS
jgi:hypothetical protein